MGFLEVAHLGHALPDGRALLSDVSFKVPEGSVTALVGANGTGKTTLLRLIAGDLPVSAGTVTVTGGLGVMRQFIGGVRDDSCVRDLLVSLAPEPVRRAAEEVDAAEEAMVVEGSEAAQMRYAHALAEWGDVGGYDTEVAWDVATVAALGQDWERARFRRVRELSGGEQKRLALEALLRGPAQVLALDEPDNYLDVPGKRWLEDALAQTRKTVLLVSHDRELLATVAERIVTLEAQGTWTHGGGFAGYAQAREDRLDRLAEVHRRWEEEHQRLRELVVTLRAQARISPDMANRYHAMVTRLEKFTAAGPPPQRPREQKITMRLRGGRTGARAVTAERLALTGLVAPFDVEIFYGERVAVLGANGSGKSHFLRLLADPLGAQVPHTGRLALGARVVPGLFAQTHAHPELEAMTLLDILWRGDDTRPSLPLDRAKAALRRYELDGCADQRFGQLSGGQQARLQVLLLELSGATLLLLDEPTDNLDLASADALEVGLAGYEGTVVAVTHDRWFARSFDRYLVFTEDATVTESPEPVWEVARAAR